MENGRKNEELKKKLQKEYQAKYYQDNKERISEQRKIRRLIDSSVIEAEKKRRADEACRKKRALAAKEYRAKIKNDEVLSEIEKNKNREGYLKKANNPEKKQKINEKELRRHKEKMAKDPEYREKRKRYYAQRYANDPEYRERRKLLAAQRYANDPEYREKRLLASAKQRAKKKMNKVKEEHNI